MKKLLIILALMLIFTACSPTEEEEIVEEVEEEEIIEEDAVLEQFLPANYELEEAYPNLDFDQPLLLTNSNDDTGLVYVVEQGGIVKYFNNETNVESDDIFIDLSDIVDIGGNEEGLLGLAFHPNYKENGYFYVNYTASRKTIIARYSKMTDSNKGDINSGEILLEFEQPYSNHNGGHLEFGPDGYLYIATGDGGSGGDPQNNSQNRGNLLGKILRIDVDRISDSEAYSIPDDNPFVGKQEGYREEIYAYGLRNPWRFSFDKERNILIAADVGQDKIEEINIIENGGNYGWRIMEGRSIFNAEDEVPNDLIPPIWEYEHPLGKSITGGHVYYGEENPSLTGVYVYGDFISGKIWGLWIDGDGNVENHDLLDTDLMISSFGLDEDGELYIVDLNGKIYKIIES